MLEFDIWFNGKVKMVQNPLPNHIYLQVDQQPTTEEWEEMIEIFVSNPLSPVVSSSVKIEIGRTKRGDYDKILRVIKNNEKQ